MLYKSLPSRPVLSLIYDPVSDQGVKVSVASVDTHDEYGLTGVEPNPRIHKRHYQIDICVLVPKVYGVIPEGNEDVEAQINLVRNPDYDPERQKRDMEFMPCDEVYQP
ncbi:hypothetical protein AX16_003576 [Volvariella volvacea WC 439]|nr:hypothetical protein AX16_003576 [Volvariella volvacea WC 439]